MKPSIMTMIMLIKSTLIILSMTMIMLIKSTVIILSMTIPPRKITPFSKTLIMTQ